MSSPREEHSETPADPQSSALITGGSKGIGYAVAKSLVDAGWRVTITSRNEAEVQAAAVRLGQQALGLAADVRNLESISRAVQAHTEKFGGLDLLLANAGVGEFAPIDQLTAQQWQDTIDTNLTGVFYTVKAALEPLKASKGYLITLSSLAGKNPFAGGAAYNASKFGLNGLSEVMMLDLRPYGIRVTQIMPGSVATEFGGHSPSDQDAWKIQSEDIGQLVLDLTRFPARSLPSRIELRPSQPPKKG